MKFSVGTTPTIVHRHLEGFMVDFVIQNLSANNVYFLESDAQSTADGIKLVPTTGSLSKDKWLNDIIIVADGATSDVRVSYQVYRMDLIRRVK